MDNVPQLLVESSFCLIVFYAFYQLILSKETFFQLNRLYLLLAPFFALLIPLINIELYPDPVESYTPMVQVIYPVVEETVALENYVWSEVVTKEAQMTLADIIWWVYVFGAFILLCKLFTGIFKLYWVIAKSRIRKIDQYHLVPNSGFPASSFFGYVFWRGDRLTKEQELVWEHEKVHVRQWHSLDVLLMECWVILQWFNPLIYFFRQSLRVTHEYIADRYVAVQIGSKYQYATYLAGFKEADSCSPLLNNFAQLLKKRLLMLAQKNSKQWKYSKYFLTLPLFFSVMLLFSFDLVEDLPEPVSQSFESAENYLSELGDREVGDLKSIIKQPMLEDIQANRWSPGDPSVAAPTESTEPKPMVIREEEERSITSQQIRLLPTRHFANLEMQTRKADPSFQIRWEDKVCDCKPGQLPNYYHCENRTFRLPEFRKMARSGGFKILRNGQVIQYRDLQVQSKRALKMKPADSQFDYQNIFQPKSEFWKKLKKGDVLKFTFQANEKDAFHFDLTINDKSESFDHAYDFYLGDIWVPIDMTSNIGIKYVTYEEYKAGLNKPIRFIKNIDEEVQMDELFANNAVIALEQGKVMSAKATEIPVINAVIPGGRASFSIKAGDQKFSIRVEVKKNETLVAEKMDIQLKWGDFSTNNRFATFLVTSSQAKELAALPIKLVGADEDVRVTEIEQVHLSAASSREVGHRSSYFMGREAVTECKVEDYASSRECLNEALLQAEEVGEVILNGVRTSNGKEFQLRLRVLPDEDAHEAAYFGKVGDDNPNRILPYWLSYKGEEITDEVLTKFANYRSLEGKIPALKIDDQIYQEEEAVAQLRKLHPYQVLHIRFMGAGYMKSMFRFQNKERKMADRAEIVVVRKQNDVLKKQVLEGENEVLGRQFFVVVDGQKKGVLSGSELKRVMRDIKKEGYGIDVIELAKGSPEMVERYGEDARVGLAIIRTTKQK